MADIIKELVEFGFKINSALETDGDNAEGCRRIDDLLGRVRAIPKRLQGSPNMVEGLRQALERASEFVANYKGKPFVSRAFNAGGIAEKLRRVCEDVLLNMNAVQLNMMAELRADVTHNKKNVDKILLIVTKQQGEKAKLVKDYQISSQTKNERATKKTGVASTLTLRRRLNGGGDARTHLVPSASFPHVLRGARRAVRERRRSVGVSAAPFHPQKIISISEEPGETGRYKISPHSSKTSKQERAQDLKIISRSIENMTSVTSIDAHPTKTWILTGHKGGNFSIWDYQKQKTVELQVNEVPDKAELKWHEWGQYVKEKPLKHPVFSAKFIGKGKRLVVGDGHGYIYVYDYIDTKLHKVKKFKAHNKSVNSLAAHPTEPYLLSSSAFSNNIKVWDWSNDWKQIRNIYVKPEVTYYTGVLSVKFNPRDTDTFACVTDDKSVKVGNLKTSSLETTLKGPYVEADYFFTRSHQHLMVTLRSDSHNSEIRDLKTGKVVHTLSESGRKTTQVACHPKLPILVTTLDDGTVCLWDASTYRLEKMVHITNSECRALVFLPDTNGLPRLAVAFEKMIAIMEVNLPIASTSNASG